MAEGTVIASDPTWYPATFTDLADTKTSKLLSDIPIPIVGEPLSKHPNYDTHAKYWKFYEVSYRGGYQYKTATAPDGREIFVKHVKEEQPEWDQRLRWAWVPNRCRQIVDDHNGFVFREHVDREDQNERFVDWSADVDGQETSIHDFMRKAMLRAQKFGCYYLVADTTRFEPSDLEITQAQAEERGDRLLFGAIDPRNIIDWRERSGQLTQALLVYDDNRSGVLFYPGVYYLFTLDEGKVTSLEGPIANNYGPMPIFRVVPFDDTESQLVDIAPLNAAAFNMVALLVEEIVNNTFTQKVISGASVKDVLESQKKLGTGFITVLANQNASISTVSGDAQMVQVLREVIADLMAEIRNNAGLQRPEAQADGSPESGVAIRLNLYRISARLAAIAKAAQRAERWMARVWGHVNNAEIKEPTYKTQFELQDDLEQINRAVSVNGQPFFPPSLKMEETRRLARLLHESWTPEQRDTFETELTALFAREQAELDQLTQVGDELIDDGSMDDESGGSDENSLDSDPQGVQDEAA